MENSSAEYDFLNIEKRWQNYWDANKTFKANLDLSRPKYYILDMFPYPSGAGLHIGHPEGYTASDILARYKRAKGFNVLHPMGWDAFGLPAEQYALKTGTHPATTTKKNIDNFRRQIKSIGFGIDWDREINTTDENYFKWTQWIFLKLFEKGLAYVDEKPVWWCPKLGTVLANEEVIDGKSEVGKHPVERRKLRQWVLKITSYADKLLAGLKDLDWPDSTKRLQANWIGRSEGAEVEFKIKGFDEKLKIFTTRPDTLYGVTYMVIAPEHPLVQKLTTEENKAAVAEYIKKSASKSDLDRTDLAKDKSGVFSGSYAINPLTNKEVPIWIADYVLMSYGTGAIMAVPAHDDRDYDFAEKYNLPVIRVIDKKDENGNDIPLPFTDVGKMVNSEQWDGTDSLEGKKKITVFLEEKGCGKMSVNYKLRDWLFSRQRYWGEPFPVYYKHGIPTMIPEDKLPLKLPEIDQYKPTESGEPPLGRAKLWAWDEQKGEVVNVGLIDEQTVFPLDLNTMPGFAGSSAYYLRYMDPHDNKALVSPEADQYWRNVDLYVGGTEHATGHLIYSRFWNKFLHDYGVSCVEEPFQKLVNQGMIQGRSNFVYRVNDSPKDKPLFVSAGLKDQYETTPIHVWVNLVKNDVLDTDAFRQWRPEYNNAEFVLEDGKYRCGWAIEKMSKSMFNVVNPDDIVADYGADTLRLYEMFLGPVEASKPWDTNGIDGCFRFLKKLWNLFWDKTTGQLVADKPATADNLRSVHKLIKKVSGDIEAFSYNTSISAFMICVNELGQQKCQNHALLEKLVVALAPFCPHIAEELWHALGHDTTVCDAPWPDYDDKYLVESTVQLTISFNGKARFQMEFPADATSKTIEEAVLSNERSQRYIDGKQILKVIVVPKRIVNVVLKK